MIAARHATALLLGAAAFNSAAAQQKTIPVRTLTPVLSATEGTFGTVALRSLSNGSLFVNDSRYHRLYLFDSTLTKFRVVFDSVSGRDDSYGDAPAPLLAYIGDTSIMLDLSASALLVLDPNGKIMRTMAQPSATNPVGPAAKADNKGRLIYRGRGGGPGAAPRPAGVPDSVVLVRADIINRKIDTIASIRVAGPGRSDSVRGPEGQMLQRILQNPLPISDDWAVLADGSLALVRASDYHIDWVRPDGKRESTPKMPIDWRRLTDAEKQHLVDSLQAQADAMNVQLAGGLGPAGRGGDGGGRGGDGVAAGRGGGGGGRGGGDAGGAGGGPARGGGLRLGVVPVSEVPDYVPPIRLNQMRADFDGNLWIPPVTSILATPTDIVYDVVNLKGEIIERVKVPIGKTIAGFGKGGNIYLSVGNGGNGIRLERVRVQR